MKNTRKFFGDFEKTWTLLSKIRNWTIITAIGLLVIGFSCKIADDLKTSIITGTVINVLERLTNEGTVHTVLIRHDNKAEVFEVRDNVLQSKYNNIELIMQLQNKLNQKIKVKVSGYGKSLFFDYRNILSIEDITNSEY